MFNSLLSKLKALWNFATNGSGLYLSVQSIIATVPIMSSKSRLSSNSVYAMTTLGIMDQECTYSVT